ncbi:MAG: hypothetical protein AABX86_02345 [Nanoarchaeota archaeon]
MTYLVACLSTGKGTWKEVTAVMNQQDWKGIYLITNQFGKEKFTSLKKGTEMLVMDFDQDIVKIRDALKENLKGKIKDTEVAVNISSGAGKEHMALVSALLQLGLAIRFVIPSGNTVEEV